jgi:hypothetical protein
MHYYFIKSQFSWCSYQWLSLYAAITDSDFIYKMENKNKKKKEENSPHGKEKLLQYEL